jgi:hypothetical protein
MLNDLMLRVAFSFIVMLNVFMLRVAYYAECSHTKCRGPNFWSGGLPESSNFRMAIRVKSKAPTLFIWGLNQNGQWTAKLNLDAAWVS